MVIPKRHRIILKSKTSGNSEDRPDNSAIIFEYIPLKNLFSVLVLQPRVLADGGGVACNRQCCPEWNNDCPIFKPLHPGYDIGQIPFYPFPIIEALASEFYWSHDLTVLCLAASYFLSFPIGFAVYIVYFNPTVGKTRYLRDNCMGESGI